MANKKYYVRKFLNKKEGIAFLEITGKCKDKYDDGFEVKIGDCARHITLDFWAENQQDYMEKVDKVNLLINELEKARNWFISYSKYANVPD
jgi:hypothetical protein